MKAFREQGIAFLLVLSFASVLLLVSATKSMTGTRPADSGETDARPLGPDSGSVPGRPPAEMERSVAAAINLYRVRHGLRSLALSERLAEIARAHSAEMARGGFMAHRTPRGVSTVDRVRSHGVSYIRLAENIAMSRGEADPVSTVVEGWIHSPSHRTNILAPEYRETGVGVVVADNGAVYFTHLFLDPPASP